MKPELQIAITNASELVRASIWHQEHVRVRVEDLKALLEAVKPPYSPRTELVVNTPPPEDFLEKLHDKAVRAFRPEQHDMRCSGPDLEELAGVGGVK